jgi:hypothetical protein
MSDNISDKISNSILGSSDISSIPSLSSDIGISSSSSDSSMSSFFDWIKEISLTTWLLIILILAFLGFNIFIYLAKGTQEVNSVFAPLIQKVVAIFGGVTGQVVDVSAEGAKAVVNTSADVVTTGLTGVQNITPSKQVQPKTSQTTTKGQDIKTTFPQGDVAQANTVNKAINSSTAQKQQVNGEDYQADEASSTIQNGASKAGWCYIGEDRGFRSCAEVGVNDTCMSGDIFPTSQVCVNPSLRA